MRLRSWPSGKPIQVYVLRDTHPTHIRFCKQVLNIFPHQLRFAWDRQVYSGTGQAPREVESVEEMRAQVAATPGALGYLQRSRVDDSVRVLPIQ
jgi:ABC-type phosphate transport system substrate-binding protein